MLIKILISCCLLCMSNAKGCNKTLHELGDLQGKFLRCVTTNSVPVTMCSGCKLEHEDMLHLYDEFSQSCNATFFNKDRLNIVPSAQALLTGLWTKAYCDDCFNNDNIFIFANKSADFYGCLIVNHDMPCIICKNVYMELNSFYVSLDRHNDGEVCFDIQDSMNRTRYKWSKELQCFPQQYNVLYFSIALAMTTCITLMFYCGTYLITKRQERNHGILNDEDPLFNSPSSSLPTVTRFNISNNQTQIDGQYSINEDNNAAPSTSQTSENNKISNAEEDTEDSSDDEPLIRSSTIKEKLK